MKILFSTNTPAAWTLSALGALWLFINDRCAGAAREKSDVPPPGSLILRGSPMPTPATSPEHLFGLEMERTTRTNGYSISLPFDLDAFYRRLVTSLPASDDIKDRLYAATRRNEVLRKQILSEVFADITGSPIRFLGVRRLGAEFALLFGEIDRPLADRNIGDRSYVAYVTERLSDGGVRLVDVQRFQRGELLSQTMRRQTLMELFEKRLLADELSATDQATMPPRVRMVPRP